MNLPVILAIVAFSLFVIYSLVTRTGRKPDPLRRLGRDHLIFGAVYFASTFFIRASLLDLLVGFYVYLALQYPFFFVFFGQISRGFSLNICVSAFRNGGRITEEEILKNYGDGRGIAYVKSDRLRVMHESGVVKYEGGKLVLTRKGRITVIVNRLLLRALHLDYLGREKAAL